MSYLEDEALLRAAVKVQAVYRGFALRAEMQHQILLNYTDYDPEFDKRLLLFSESRKMRKLRYAQMIYRQYRARKKQRAYAKVLQNTLYFYLYFFRKKVRWLKENIGTVLLVSSVHADVLKESLDFFVNAPFQTRPLQGIGKYGSRPTFYHVLENTTVPALIHKTPTVIQYATRFYRDAMYRIRFRQPVYGSGKKRKVVSPPKKPSAFAKPSNIFISKLTDVIVVSSKATGAEADSQLAKLFFILRRNAEIFTLDQVVFCAAAVAIQRRWRGSYCRMKMLPLMITNLVEKRAAVLLQRWWRCAVGIKKRFRVLSIVLSAVRRIEGQELFVDALTYFQLLQTKTLPILSHSVSSYPEFSGVPVVNLNGQVMFKKYRRSRCCDAARKTMKSGMSSKPEGIIAPTPHIPYRSIPKWVSLFKLAAESRYNALSYERGAIRDLDGIGEIKSTIVTEGKLHHHSNLQDSFNQGKILFNLLTNGCTISMQSFPVLYERRAVKGVSMLDSMSVVKLRFPSVLEARCRCAMVMLASMDTAKEECVSLLSKTDMTTRLGQISKLSDVVSPEIFSQLTADRRRTEGSAFGEYSGKSGIFKHQEVLQIQNDWRGTSNIYSSLGNTAIILHMKQQIPMYVYNDLFSMGVLVDDEDIGPIDTGVVGADLTPVPFLRPIRDPLEYILRLNGWPRQSSTPSWLRREKRDTEDTIRFKFFLESLRMYPCVESAADSFDYSMLVSPVKSDRQLHTASRPAAVIDSRPGTASLRPSSLYKNKNSTDGTGVGYWTAWEQEIPNASLNGVKPSSPEIAVSVLRSHSSSGRRPGSAGVLIDEDGIMGVFPTNPPKPTEERQVSSDKILFPRAIDPAPTDIDIINDDINAEFTGHPMSGLPPKGARAMEWNQFNEQPVTSERVGDIAAGHPPGSPRWLRRHLWSIPRVLMWCADNVDTDVGSSNRRILAGYAELQKQKRIISSANGDIDINAGFNDESVEEMPSPERPRYKSPRKMNNRASTASARLDIIQHAKNKMKYEEQTQVLEKTRASVAEAGATRRSSTVETPRPHSPFFRDPVKNYAVSIQTFSNNPSTNPTSSTPRRPQTAASWSRAALEHGEATTETQAMPQRTSPIVGSNPSIRSGKEEFVRSRNAEARELREHLNASRQLTEAELETIRKEKQDKIRDEKDRIAQFDLPGKLEKKREILTAANRAEKEELGKQFEQFSEAKMSTEEQNRQRIRERRGIASARSKHRVNVVKNNVTLCALSKYAKTSQLREHKEMEKQRIKDKRNTLATKGDRSRLKVQSAAADAAFSQAVGFYFDESSITDSINSNELINGILQLSEHNQDGRVDRSRRPSANSKYVTAVMVQNSELSKTVESMDSILSRSSHGHKIVKN